MESVFQVMPTRDFIIMFAVIMAAVSMSLIPVFIRYRKNPDDPKTKTGLIISLAVTSVVDMLLVVLFAFGPISSRITVSDSLHVKSFPYIDKTVEYAGIRSVITGDWKTMTGLAPVLRTGGISMAGYRAGLFRLKNGETARVLANSFQVAVLSTDKGLFILSPGDMTAFTNALAARGVRIGE